MKKFQLIYEEILSKSINVKDFKYKFSLDTIENTLTCDFESIDKTSNKLIFIKAIVYDNNNIEFIIKKQNKEKTYTDKEFLFAYYKEYHNFKLAYKIYKDNPNFFEKQEKEPEQNQDNIPKIETLDEILNKENQTDNGILIKKNGINFIFKALNDENINDLISCEFDIKNTSNVKSSDDLQEYKAIATIKIYNFNSKILSVKLLDPKNINNSEENKEYLKDLTAQDFAHKFKNINIALNEALDIYERKYENQSIKNI